MPATRNALILLVLLGAVGSPGCMHSYRLRVDALHDPLAARAQSYRVAAPEPGDGPADEETYAEAVKLVQAALAQKGMYPAPEGQPADVELAITYDVSAPRHRVRRIHEATFDDGDRPSPTERQGGGPNVGPTPSGTVQDPIPADRGSRMSVTQVFEKRLEIVARMPRREGQTSAAADAEIWRVQVSVENEGPEVENVLPVLARTAADHVGQDVRAKRITTQLASN